MVNINIFVLLLLTALSVPLFIVCIYYGFGYSVLERFADPSFDLKLKRILELTVSYFIFSIITTVFLNLLASHFHFSETIVNSPSQVMVPAILFLITRSIVRLHSSRIGREHINMIVFIILVGSGISLGLSLFEGVKAPFRLMNFDLLGAYIISSLIIPIVGDTLLFTTVEKYGWIKRWFVKKKRLIDLTDELPVTLHFLCGEESIKNKIKELIINSDNLCILTKGFTTVDNNATIILEKLQGSESRGKVKIIGKKPEKETDYNYDEVNERIERLKKQKINMCFGKFDDIRVVINDNKQVMLSFATGGYKESHVGIFSEHPFIVALFQNYFEAKCKQLKSDNLCFNSCSERRKFQRMFSDEPIKYYSLSSKKEALNQKNLNQICLNEKYNDGVAVNICEGGLCMKTDYLVKKGDFLFFNPEIKIKNIMMNSSIVRWVTENKDNGYNIGLEFR